MDDLFGQAMERIDLELVQEYKEKGYVIDCIKKRAIQFSHSLIELKRQRMRKKSKKNIIPLDAAIWLVPYNRDSPLLEMRDICLTADTVCRKVSPNV